jgi:hypothetical protein
VLFPSIIIIIIIIIMYWCKSALISSDSTWREGGILRDGEGCGFSELTNGNPFQLGLKPETWFKVETSET